MWTNLNLLHRMMLCAKFGWNWPCGSGKEQFKFLSMYFCYFTSISPWKRAWPFFLTNLHSRMDSPKDALCCLVEIDHVLEKIFFFKMSIYFRCFVIIYPWKKVWSFIWTDLNPLHPRKLWAMFGWNSLRCSGEEDEKLKKITTTTTMTTTPTTMDNGQILIRKAHLSLRLR